MSHGVMCLNSCFSLENDSLDEFCAGNVFLIDGVIKQDGMAV